MSWLLPGFSLLFLPPEPASQRMEGVNEHRDRSKQKDDENEDQAQAFVCKHRD
ncbi:hypothetical protein [Pseudomonas syringae group genomosp. 3]|uniref:hypothetical protein n=1 Tax=Pseudomonas syringae group genomosp. 3 TaxID=251701 RepID=UPI001396508E|nr:hypothetical protein [Pseudomonas syringae group genomosp. 3]